MGIVSAFLLPALNRFRFTDSYSRCHSANGLYPCPLLATLFHTIHISTHFATLRLPAAVEVQIYRAFSSHTKLVYNLQGWIRIMIKFKKLGLGVVEQLRYLPQILSAYPEVVAVYLFGSFAKGEVKPLSDIDIAYLLYPQPSEDYLDKDLGLQAAITRALGTDEVDCYLLNKAPLPLQHEVIRTGKVIYCRDPAAKERYENEVKQAYEQRRGEFEVTKQQLLKAFKD